MRIEGPYKVYGDSSDEVTVVVRSIAQNDTTDPLNVAASYIDFVDEGYSVEGEPLDGSAAGGFTDGRVSLLHYEWIGPDDAKRYVNLYVEGDATQANGIPYRFCAAATGAGKLTFNVARMPGIVTEVAIVFQRPDGTQVVVERYQRVLE